MRIRNLLLTFSCLHLLLAVDGRAQRTDDHLIPFKPSVYDELRPFLYKKLCITPANYGRMIELPAGPEHAEWAVSVYCNNSSGSAEVCGVTLTRAASNLDSIMQERRGRNPLQTVGRVRVLRKDARIQKATAVAVRAAWLRFLNNSKPSPSRPNDPVWFDTTKIEFWLEIANGERMKAEIPDAPGNAVMNLVKIGRLLAKYCEGTPLERAGLLNEIRARATDLFGSSR